MKSYQLYFLFTYGCYLLLGAGLLLWIEKGQEIWWFNALHTPILDTFMKYLTHIGDGLFATFLVIALLFWRYDYAMVASVGFVVSSLFTQSLKKLVFADQLRPWAYLQENSALHLVEGVEVHKYFSFPSGHSTTVFFLACLFSLLLRNAIWSVVFVLLAILVSLTRLYLVQHFFMDTYFGSLIGTGLMLLIWQGYQNQTWIKHPKWQSSLRTLFDKNNRVYE